MTVKDVDRPIDIEQLRSTLERPGPYPWTFARDVRIALNELEAARKMVTLRGGLEMLRDEAHRVVIARNERDGARAIARVLAHAYTHDSRPPAEVVADALAFPVFPRLP